MATIQELQLLNQSMGQLADTFQRNREFRAREREVKSRSELEREMANQRAAEASDASAHRRKALDAQIEANQAAQGHQRRMEENADVANKIRSQALESEQGQAAVARLSDAFKTLEDGVRSGSIEPREANRRAKAMLEAMRDSTDHIIRASPFAALLDGDGELFKSPPPRGNFATRDSRNIEEADRWRSEAAAETDPERKALLLKRTDRLEQSVGRTPADEFETVTDTTEDIDTGAKRSVSRRVPAGTGAPAAASAPAPAAAKPAARPGSTRETAIPVSTSEEILKLDNGTWVIFNGQRRQVRKP